MKPEASRQAPTPPDAGDPIDPAGPTSPLDPPGPTSSVGRAARWSLLAIIALGTTRLLYNVIVGRAEGPTVLGRVNEQIAFAMLATILVSAGTAAAASKFIAAATAAGRPAEASAVGRVLGRWTLIGTAVTTAIAAVVGRLTLARPSALDLGLTLGVVGAYAGYTFTKGALYGSGQVRPYVLLEVLSDVATLTLTVVAVLLSSTVLLVPLIVGYGGFAVAAWRRCPRGGDPTALDPARRREVRSFVVLAVLGTVASTGFLQLSMIVARRYGTPLEAGYYAASLSLVAPAYFLPRALSLALFPAMAGAHSRGEASTIARQTDIGTRLLAVGMLPMFAAAIFLAQPVLAVAFGSRYSGAGALLGILLAATFVSILPVPSVNSLSAVEQRYVHVSAWASAAGFVIGVLWWVSLGPGGGTTAVAVGYLVGSLVQAAVPVGFAWWRHRQRWTWLWVRVAAASGVGYLLAWWLHRRDASVLTALAVTAAFTLGWCLLTAADLRLLVRRLVGRR